MVDVSYVQDLLDTADPASLREEDLDAVLNSPAHQFKSLSKGDVIDGIVARIDNEEVLVDIGLKSEGIVSGRELGTPEDIRNLRVGSAISVAVLVPETPEGNAVLSIRRAKQEKSWRYAEQVMQDNEIIEAEVIDYNKGGLIVNVQGLRGFVPISQVLGLRRDPIERTDSGEDDIAQRLAEMVGRTLSLKVIELIRGRNRLILSERAALLEARAKNKDQLLEELEVGQVRRGRVSNILPFGVFVDLGGADGLIHISQLSYSHVANPSDLLHVGDEVDVYVLSIDPVKKKIALSLKRAQADPWDTIEERYQIGQIVRGTVTKITQFGAFARVEDGIEGLAHVSELSNRHVTNPREVAKEGDELDFQIISIDGRRRRLGLSLRALEDSYGVEYATGEGEGESVNEGETSEDLATAPAVEEE
ncbi:MAG: S1 RNA-binding domain-containing protein [Chloroflexi bacterium]|nr:S1 RNA-binding domain-containing protein [Chloroflexota bacterium]